MAVMCQSSIKSAHDMMAEQQFCFNQGEKKRDINMSGGMAECWGGGVGRGGAGVGTP